MKKLSVGILASLMSVWVVGTARAEIASKGFVDARVDELDYNVGNNNAGVNRAKAGGTEETNGYVVTDSTTGIKEVAKGRYVSGLVQLDGKVEGILTQDLNNKLRRTADGFVGGVSTVTTSNSGAAVISDNINTQIDITNDNSNLDNSFYYDAANPVANNLISTDGRDTALATWKAGEGQKPATSAAVRDAFNELDHSNRLFNTTGKSSDGARASFITQLFQLDGHLHYAVDLMDETPTAESGKPVTSRGIKSYVDDNAVAKTGHTAKRIETTNSDGKVVDGTLTTGMTDKSNTWQANTALTNTISNSGNVTIKVAEGTPQKFGVVQVGTIPSGSMTSTTYSNIWVQ